MKNVTTTSKYLLLVSTLLAVVLSSCQFNDKADTDEIKDNIVYFRDSNTGLCFAAINSINTKSLSSSSSITCVPCDSLKRIKVK